MEKGTRARHELCIVRAQSRGLRGRLREAAPEARRSVPPHRRLHRPVVPHSRPLDSIQLYSTLLHITLVLVYSTLSPRRDRTATSECSTLYASVSRVVRFVSPLLSAPLRSFGISAAKSRAERSGSDRRASRNAMSHRRRRVAVAVAFDVDVVRFSRAFALSETKL